MEKKIAYSGNLKGIQRNKPTAFTTFDQFEEATMCITDSNGLYKVRRPLPSSYDSTSLSYTYVQDVVGLRPRGLKYIESSPNPSILYFYGDKCIRQAAITQEIDRIKFIKNAGTTIWTGKGSATGNKYKFENFISAAGEDYLFCVGGDACEWIKISNCSTGTVGVLPTSGCTAVCLKDSRLWVASGDKLFYSTVNDGLTFNASNFLRLFENDIVCDMKVYNNLIFVFTDKKIYYVDGNDTSDFLVKVMEETRCIPDSTFEADSDGIYFMDKYANIRIISSNPNYQSAAKSVLVSDKLNIFDTLSSTIQFPSFCNFSKNQDLLHTTIGVSSSFNYEDYEINCQESSTTDFTKTGTWTNSGDTWSITANSLERDTIGSGFHSANINPNNSEFTFQSTVDNSYSLIADTRFGIFNDMTTPTKFFSIDIEDDLTCKFRTNAATTTFGTLTNLTKYYFRIVVTDYSIAAKTATISYWVKATDPAGSWGIADLTVTGADFNFTPKIGMVASGFSQKIENFLYDENAVAISVLLADIHNLIFDVNTKEWTEYSVRNSSNVKTNTIEYMSSARDKLFNTIQFVGCQYTTTVGLYTDTNNFIGCYNQRGITKDNSKMYLLSNPFNFESPNKKILRQFYIDFYPITATVYLYLQNDVDFASIPTVAMTIRSGWNTLPRTFRGRQFKWGLLTTNATEFQLKQVGFEFDDLGSKAF